MSAVHLEQFGVVAQLAVNRTLEALIEEGLLSDQQATNFLLNRIASVKQTTDFEFLTPMPHLPK